MAGPNCSRTCSSPGTGSTVIVREQGGSAALVLEGGRTRSTSARWRAGPWDVGSGARFPAQLTVGLGWQHASGDTDVPAATARSVAMPSMSGAVMARNALVSQLGVAVGLGRNSQLSMFVQGQHGDGRRDVGGQINLRVGFWGAGRR